jgi:hypothetical protein
MPKRCNMLHWNRAKATKLHSRIHPHFHAFKKSQLDDTAYFARQSTQNRIEILAPGTMIAKAGAAMNRHARCSYTCRLSCWPAGFLTIFGRMVALPLAIRHRQCGIGTSGTPFFLSGRSWKPEAFVGP